MQKQSFYDSSDLLANTPHHCFMRIRPAQPSPRKKPLSNRPKFGQHECRISNQPLFGDAQISPRISSQLSALMTRPVKCTYEALGLKQDQEISPGDLNRSIRLRSSWFSLFIYIIRSRSIRGLTHQSPYFLRGLLHSISLSS